MFKKELADVLKQTAIFLPVAALVPALILALRIVTDASYLDVFLPLYQVALLFWALFLGSSLLMRERDQHAVEYALSMPYSRLRLFGLKILPRAAVLAGLYAIFLILNGPTAPLAMGAAPFTITLVLLFVVSVCLAPLVENFLVLAFLTMFSTAAGWIALLTIIWLIDSPVRSGLTWIKNVQDVFTLARLYSDKWLGPLLWAGGLIVLVPFVLAFLHVVRKFDVKPVVHHGRRFAAVFGPAALAAVVAIYLLSNSFIPPPDAYFDLTRDLKLVEYKDSACTVYDKDRKTKIHLETGINEWTTFIEGKTVYYWDDNDKLRKLDLESGAVTDYPLNEQDVRGSFSLRDGRCLYYFKSQSANEAEMRLVRWTLDSAERSEIIFQAAIFQKGSARLFGTNAHEGKRYWLAQVIEYFEQPPERHLLRLWEDGRVESAPASLSGYFVAYFNRLLFAKSREAVTIYEDTGTGVETLKTIACDRESSPFFIRRGSLRSGAAEPVGNSACYTYRGRIFRLDFETLETEEIGTLKPGTDSRILNLYAFGSILDEEAPALKQKTFYRIEGRRLIPIRSFPLTKIRDVVYPNEGISFTEWKEHFQLDDAGIILTKGSKVRVFAWPDLRELKFKGL